MWIQGSETNKIKSSNKYLLSCSWNQSVKFEKMHLKIVPLSEKLLDNFCRKIPEIVTNYNDIVFKKKIVKKICSWFFFSWRL